MVISPHIREKLSLLPTSPGVYQYFDASGTIIYVGKAKNLKRRVSSYFQKEHSSRKTQQLVESIVDLQYIVVNSEQDAFLLENNLIKKYQPRYNILLKDGKSYPSICITKEPFPRVFKTRQIIRGAGEYFGPYSFGNTVDLVLELIHRLYPLRTCALKLSPEGIAEHKYKVCLKYHIQKCCGVCEGCVSQAQYGEYIQQVRKIIQGDAHEISHSLLAQMQQLSAELRFEEAQVVKEKYDLVENFKSKTIITNTHLQDMDVFGYEQEEEQAYISILRMHKGSIVQGRVVSYKHYGEEEPPEILGRAVMELREQMKSNSPLIIVPFLPDFIDENIQCIVPTQGDRKKLLDLAMQNVHQYQKDRQLQQDKLNPDQRSMRVLEKLQHLLGLEKIPITIECFDNSNLQGADAVAGCVVFSKGKPNKQEYRRFMIKKADGNDDYGAMREVVFRRYQRCLEEGTALPDLIIADGGVGQMHAIHDSMEHLGLTIPIAGLVKNEHHRTTSLLFGFPPQAVDIKPTDEVFFLLAKIQEEVHRFAIAYHRQKRSKAQITSELDNIPSIGSKSKAALLKAFKSLKRMQEATEEDLAQVIGPHRASLLYRYFHG